MSIKPIDAQIMMNNTPHAEKFASARALETENAQVQVAQEMQKKIEQDAHQISATKESAADNKINKKPENDKREKDQQQKKKKRENEQQGSTIDVRI